MLSGNSPAEFKAQLAQRDPAIVQRTVLLERIIGPNASCEYGRKHGFASIRSVQEFRKAVPANGYEAFRPWIDRMLTGEQGVLVSEPVRRFFLTSGSASAPKYVPVTNTFIRDKWRALQTYWGLVRHDHPWQADGSVVANFSDGAYETKTAGSAFCSSESSFWSSFGHADRAARPVLPRDILKIPDPESRYYAIARTLLATKVAVLMSLNPSTLQRLFDVVVRNAESLLRDVTEGGISETVPVNAVVREYFASAFEPDEDRARRLARVLGRNLDQAQLASRLWPSLGVTICWRSAAVRPYLDLLEPFLLGHAQRDYITMASEGIIAIPFEDSMSGGALALDAHFYEFIPEEAGESGAGPPLGAHELEKNKDYAVLLTTSAGLYRYKIGDVVQVRDFIGGCPIVEFRYRRGHTCSLTGEKLTEAQVAAAVAAAAGGTGVLLAGFTMCPVALPFPHYALVAELRAHADASRLHRFIGHLEERLWNDNVEYRSKRVSQRLGAPELLLAPCGTYERLRADRRSAGVNDAQVKLPCLTRDLTWHEQFRVRGNIACTSAA